VFELVVVGHVVARLSSRTPGNLTSTAGGAL